MQDDDFVIIAFTALFVGLFGKMRAKGVLDAHDLNDIFDNATLRLEEMGLHNRPAARKAHGFLTSIQQVLEGVGSASDK